ncbi:SDR family oxidoreductase [Nocardia sp. NPDC101769]|uniref:SDR family oxidoreductase n=1 Tax=Nocardia sp. NPDC101769 TaxID=3364333 RepID=UPI0037F4189C
MSTRNKILVTGGTGTVGGQVAQLLAADADVRVLTRSPSSALLPSRVEVVGGDLSDPATVAPALTGVDAVFLVWPFADADRAPDIVDLIAERARRVVYLSSAAVRDNERRIEELLEKSRLEWTFLRPNVFAANTLRWAEQIRADGAVREPFGSAAMPPIHEHDIAAVAVHALTRDGHAGAVYNLTGPELLTHADQARIIGDEIGRPVRWVETSPESARQRMLGMGWAQEAVDGVLAAQAAMITNPALPTSAVHEVTGTAARTFRQWAADHADDFR